MVKLKNILVRSIHIIAALLFVWIIFLLIFCEGFIEYACKIKFLTSNIVILVFLTFLVGTIVMCCIKMRSKQVLFSDLDYGKIVKISTFILLALQIYICFNIFFITGWDSGSYVIPAARALAEHGDTKAYQEYLSMYPNNLFLVNIYYFILKINNIAGIFTGDYQLMSIVICNCVISSFTCRLIYVIGSKKFDDRYAFIGYVIALILIGMSPWMVVCYSDSFALFIPIFIIYMYMNERIPYSIRYLMIFVVGYLGYCIKPQVFIVVIAIIVVESIKKIGQTSMRALKKDVINICISGIIIAILSSGLHDLYRGEGFDFDSDKKIGITHYFMMGLNPKDLGVWSGEDVKLSISCKNQEERTKKNIEKSRERLTNYGIIGYLKLLSKKILTNYNDGTFAWGVEGNFYAIVPEDINTSVSGKLKKIYYNGALYSCFFYLVEQCIWILVIVLSGIRTVYVVITKDYKMDYEYLVIILSIIGLTVFQLLFESRARYLYIYIPVFILVAIYGIRDFSNRIIVKDRTVEL